MGNRIGNGYMGSDSVKTSTANQEVVPPTPANWFTKKLSFYKFSFDNETACTVKINSGSPIYLKDGQGFECSEIDAPITSFVIVESGINFNWLATF